MRAQPRSIRPRRLRMLGLALAVLACASAAYALVAQRDRQPALGDLTLCKSYDGLPIGFAVDAHAGMVELPGGTFVQGSEQGYADERPLRARRVEPFWIDRTEVTNAQFLAFVQATGYVTVAEREGGAAVFHTPTEAELSAERYAFWRYQPGANFRHPEGPDSQITDRQNRPVVQVAFEDATAYARWLGHELPTEAEWEYAARAQRDDQSLHKAPRDAHDKPTANFWQGDFPLQNSQEDGFYAQAPAGCYAPNPFGLYDTIGNVWEWTLDVYTDSHAEIALEDHPTSCATDSESGAMRRGALERVIKGGSFLCSASFCARYRVSARHPQEENMPAWHVGFRTVAR